MAFSKGSVSTEGATFRRYKGIAPVFIRGINPSRQELSKFYGHEIEEEPVYISTYDDPSTGNKLRQIRIDFLLEVDPKFKDKVVLKNEDGSPISLKTRLSFTLIDTPRIGSQSLKHQVIDEYGRTAWVTPEQLAAHEIPQYSNGPASITSSYREAYSGEEAITSFLIAFLNIPSPTAFGSSALKPEAELEKSLARFDHISDWFTGDISEIRQAVASQPENKVKVMFGIRLADNGNTYQSVYNRFFLRSSASSYSRFEREIQDLKNGGRESNTDYDALPLHESTLAPTDFSPSPDATLSQPGQKLPWE